MKFCRKTLVYVATLLLGTLVLPLSAAGDLENWIPGNGALYGKVSGNVILQSSLYKHLSQKYPVIRQYMDAGREYVGNYQGELVTAVFTIDPSLQGMSVLLEFSHPYDPAAVEAGITRSAGLAGKYQKFTVAGKTGFVLTKPTPQGRSCFVMLSDRVMLGCLENAAESIITGPKLAGTQLQRLMGKNGTDVFFTAFPGSPELLQGASIRDFDAVGRLTADAALKLALRVAFPDEMTAQNMEQQLRQGMMIMLGMAFADDAELGMEVISRLKIKRKNSDISMKFTLPANLIERLVTYSTAQIEKRKKAEAEQARKRTEQQQQTALPGNSGI